MKFSVPMEANDIVELPDNSNLIENLASRKSVDQVVPTAIGDEETGRFVVRFHVFQNGSVTAFSRRRDGQEGTKFSKVGRESISEEPIYSDGVWNSDVIVPLQSNSGLEELKTLARRKTDWLLTGDDPPEGAYIEPAETEPVGLPDCDHTNPTQRVAVVGFEDDDEIIDLVRCADCGIPVAFRRDDEMLMNYELIEREFVNGEFTVGQEKHVGVLDVEQGPPATNEELTLAFLTRVANAEIANFDIYSRGQNHGTLFAIKKAIVGYALWSFVNGELILQQIYILEDFRSSELGKDLVRNWFSNREADSYYAVGMNNAGRSLLKGIGHLPDGPATEATIFSSRDTTDSRRIDATTVELERHSIELPQSR